ncbi:hypothetical protein DUNSADRAFT_2812 [Dunaliella salina]|uniref:Encoded protein n=1 Tax=Dunaliella salina TaxID=3046 RepID=A0ABQ7GV40_DUNSA|nr:hypothetical protein DUNSADRAFT_2812 [Dunaliella salina]|eukprot:KAF5838483.1 hypothetical protein DUNSADRAFT_2812 [Dunaliella salina]
MLTNWLQQSHVCGILLKRLACVLQLACILLKHPCMVASSSQIFHVQHGVSGCKICAGTRATSAADQHGNLMCSSSPAFLMPLSFLVQVLVLQWLMAAHAWLQGMGPSIRHTFQKVGYMKAWNKRVQNAAVRQMGRLFQSDPHENAFVLAEIEEQEAQQQGMKQPCMASRRMVEGWMKLEGYLQRWYLLVCRLRPQGSCCPPWRWRMTQKMLTQHLRQQRPLPLTFG